MQRPSGDKMLAGFVIWPPEDLQRWKKAGFRPGCASPTSSGQRQTAPDKVAVIEGAAPTHLRELVEQVDRLAVALHRTG
jgi:non-ribosomal peptide synthetase component E (peptide arylation enzyme)